MTELLTAQNIQKSFGTLNVLSDISFNLAAGEIICILGTSGCGKTTLLNILAGLEPADCGTIKSSIKRPGPNIGYMTQSNPLLPWRTVLENTGLGMEFHKFDKKTVRRRSLEYLETVRLADFKDAYPDQLSGGMKQRVALARTLALHPKLLLLDEPLGSLDVAGRRRLAKTLKGYVKDRRAGAIVVTHSVEEAVFLGDRVLILTPRPAKIAAELRGESFETILKKFLATVPEGERHVA